MSRIIMTNPMGRGIAVQKSKVQTTYDDLKTLLNSSLLSNDNFSERAGIPESFIAWDYAAGHRHVDGSLGAAIISDPQLVLSGSRGVQWVLSQTPATKMIVGISQPFPLGLNENVQDIGLEVPVLFGQGSDHPSTFEPGTFPTVILSLLSWSSWNYGDGATSPHLRNNTHFFQLYLQDVTSSFFTARYFTNLLPSEQPSGDDGWRMIYCATGVAPGYLTNPSGPEA